jgi:hypothetical protein
MMTSLCLNGRRNTRRESLKVTETIISRSRRSADDERLRRRRRRRVGRRATVAQNFEIC